MNLDQNIDINLNKSIENDIGNKNTSNLNKSASDIPANSPMNNLKVEENKDNIVNERSFDNSVEYIKETAFFNSSLKKNEVDNI